VDEAEAEDEAEGQLLFSPYSSTTGHAPTNSHHLRPGIVHRLDKGTSGLLVVAKTEVSMAVSCLRAEEQHTTTARSNVAIFVSVLSAAAGGGQGYSGRGPGSGTAGCALERCRHVARAHHSCLACCCNQAPAASPAASPAPPPAAPPLLHWHPGTLPPARRCATGTCVTSSRRAACPAYTGPSRGAARPPTAAGWRPTSAGALLGGGGRLRALHAPPSKHHGPAPRPPAPGPSPRRRLARQRRWVPPPPPP
jgi:hypothetical protein